MRRAKRLLKRFQITEGSLGPETLKQPLLGSGRGRLAGYTGKDRQQALSHSRPQFLCIFPCRNDPLLLATKEDFPYKRVHLHV